MEVRFAYLLPAEFEQRLSKAPLVYVPVGSLEFHGDHLAIGNDALKMEALCVGTAKISGGVAFPAIFTAGVGMLTRFRRKYRFEGGINLRAETVMNLLLAVLRELEKCGFKAAVLITGHTSSGQKVLMQKIAYRFNKKSRMLVRGTEDSAFANSLGHTSDHAGKWETSILSHFYPELVEMKRLPKDLSVWPEGVGGMDPRIYASARLGNKVSKKIVYEIAALGRKTLREARQRLPGKAQRIIHAINVKQRSLNVPSRASDEYAVAKDFYLFGETNRRARVRTSVKLSYDKNNLYFIFEMACTYCRGKSGKQIKRIENGECLEIFVTADVNTPQRFYHIGFSPMGKVKFVEGGKAEGFQARGAFKGKKWITEAKLPARDFASRELKKGMKLLGNFCRTSRRSGEWSSWGKCFYRFQETEGFGLLKLC